MRKIFPRIVASRTKFPHQEFWDLGIKRAN